MKINFIRQIVRMAKYALIGIYLQTFLVTFLMAADIRAQQNSIDDTYLSIEFKNVNLEDAFVLIGKKTNFNFQYNKKVINREYLDLGQQQTSLGDLLRQISKEKGLSFKRINETIHVTKSTNTESLVSEDLTAPAPINITGKVTSSEDQTGLPGVNVVIKETSMGTVTDVNGDYKIDVPDEETTLIFSSIGFTRQEVVVGSQSIINIALLPDVQALEEIVVVGYGTQQKKDLTGSVASVQAEDIESRNSIQISQALQGTMPGVMVTRDNNAPGATANIRIRGITSIGESNPLIILDGIPVDNINDINPNDVESISVLKDAASASIYGSRAAAGVVVVTTKRAKSGQLSLDYNFEYGIEKATRLPDYVSVSRYMEMTNELRWNDNGNNDNEFPTYSEDLIQNYESLNAENPDFYPITNWVDLILKDNAPRQSHSISLTGGTKNIRTKASLAYDKTGALYEGRTYERITGRLNNDFKINDALSATVDLYFKRSVDEQPVVDPLYKMLIAAPIYAAEWSDGRVAGGKSGANIYGQMKYGGFSDKLYHQVGGKVSMDFTPIDGLTFTGVFAPIFDFNKEKKFNKQIAFYAYDNPDLLEGYLEGAQNTKLSEERNEQLRYTGQFLVNYTKSLGDHNLNLMAGLENYYAKGDTLNSSRDQYGLTNFPYLDLGPLEYRDNGGRAAENAYRSVFGRIMYNYRNKYYVQGNIRYDGSSRFQQDYRWGAFPSFSVGWVISEEGFMVNSPVISFLKFRGSWGTLGNERIGNYPYQATLGFSNALFYQGGKVVSEQSAAQWQYAIRDISWETTESFDVGVDANFFDDRLQLTADYYVKTTKDMLLPLEIPDYIGFDNPNQNTGTMKTKGWEMQVGWNDNLGAGKFNYSVSLNLSDFKSSMGNLGGTEFLGDKIKAEGSQFNEWYGYQSEGIYQTQEEVNNSAVLNANVGPGDIKYTDISGPNGEPDGIISPEYDRVLLGGSLPRYMFGGNIRLGYGNFDLSMIFQGVGKQNDRMDQLMVRPLMENWGHIPANLDGNYWSQYNTTAQNSSALYPRLTQVGGSNNYALSDFWLFNGGYFRLKNINLGYNFPQSFTDKIKLQRLRVYASVADLFSIDKYPQGWDPEVVSDGYPITRSFLMGVSVKF